MEKGVSIQRKLFLDVVPEEYLKGILKKKGYSNEKLKKMIETILKKKIKNPEDKINKLSHSDLVNIFINFNILSFEKEKELYLEFRDSQNPIFYLYKFQGKLSKNLTHINKEIITHFNDKILNSEVKFIKKESENQSSEILIDKLIDFQIFKSQLHQNNTILEIFFEYLERLDYLKKNYMPNLKVKK